MAKPDKIAFIGTGAMGSALIRGLISAKLAKPDNILGADADRNKNKALADSLGIAACDNQLAVRQADIVFLAVKPSLVGRVLEETGAEFRSGQILISIAAGVTLKQLRSKLQAPVSLARVMPNTPALVGAGISAVAFEDKVAKAAREKVLRLLGAAGEVVEVEEKLLNAVTGLSGSGPAYVFVFIEALADGGVAAGLPRLLAQKLAIETVLGSAALLKVTGQHPAAAKDAVASPGGTTIAGLAVLEDGAFRANIIQAVISAAARAEELSS